VRAAAALTLLLAGAFVGCGGHHGAELLELSAVEPDSGQAGDYRVLGEGFALGRPARVRLTGVVHRPGKPPAQVRAVVVGRATHDAALRASGWVQPGRRRAGVSWSRPGGRGTGWRHWAPWSSR